jgi:hypothetical protein
MAVVVAGALDPPLKGAVGVRYQRRETPADAAAACLACQV